MKLSAEQFAELAASFNATPTKGNHERRRAARMDLQARIRIHPMADGRRQDPVSVIVSNFSARGLSFINPTSIEMGTQFITALPRKGGGSVEMLCTVVHSHHAGPNAWRIGAEFTCAAPTQPVGADSADEMKRIRESMLG